jgi:uncharacterized protein (TIGR03067 family)
MKLAKLLAFPIAVAVAAAWVPAQQPNTDLDRLQGTWRAVRFQTAGGQARDVEKTGPTLTFRGDRYQWMANSITDATVKLRPDTNPKQIDIHIGSGRNKGKTGLGIYKLEGDTVTFAIAPAGSPNRPTNFTLEHGQDAESVWVFRRVKK